MGEGKGLIIRNSYEVHANKIYLIDRWEAVNAANIKELDS